MSPSCGCTCPHSHSYAPMTAQDIAVMQLALLAFLLLIPTLAGIHFWVQAKLFPGKMLVTPSSPAQSVLKFRRRTLSRVGAALTLPFLLNILAIIVWSRPSFHHLDSTFLWGIVSYPFAMYCLYGIYAVLKHLGRDELQIDVAQGVFRHRSGFPGLERTRTGKVSALGQLEIKQVYLPSSGQRGSWTVRFHKPAPSYKAGTAPVITLLGGFNTRQDAEQLYAQVRYSLENRRIVFPLATPSKEGHLFAYSPGELPPAIPDTLAHEDVEKQLQQV